MMHEAEEGKGGQSPSVRQPSEDGARLGAVPANGDSPLFPPEGGHRGFSLASILLLVTVVSVLLAAGRNASVEEEWSGQHSAPAAACGAVIGLVIGLCIGLSQPRKLLGSTLAIPIGVLAGAGGGWAAAAAANLAVVTIGGVVLVAFALVIRRLSAPPG
jgi:hypothetical protein